MLLVLKKFFIWSTWKKFVKQNSEWFICFLQGEYMEDICQTRLSMIYLYSWINIQEFFFFCSHSLERAYSLTLWPFLVIFSGHKYPSFRFHEWKHENLCLRIYSIIINNNEQKNNPTLVWLKICTLNLYKTFIYILKHHWAELE